MMLIKKAYRLKLQPSMHQRQGFMRFSGSCRWLWNKLLEINVEKHQAEGKFVFRFEMSKMLPAMKLETHWLAEAPSGSLQQVCTFLDRALRRSFTPDASGRKAGFPRYKKHGDTRSFYVPNNKMRIDGNKVVLPKVGPVRFRSGDTTPEGKILGATVRQVGDDWYCVVQCEVDVPDLAVAPFAETVVGVDVGLSTTAVLSDGRSFDIPAAVQRRANRVRLLNKKHARQVKGSNNRKKTARRLRIAHARLADARRDARHKASVAIIRSCSAVAIEDASIKGMQRGLRLGRSVGEAGLAELRHMLQYKAMWAGKQVVLIDRWYPSTQTCSRCGTRRTGEDKLKLGDRTYRCNACGHTMDRDLNAATNLRREGLKALGLDHPAYIDLPVRQGMANLPDGISIPEGEQPVERLSDVPAMPKAQDSLKQESCNPDIV